MALMRAIYERVRDIVLSIGWAFREMGPGVRAMLVLCVMGYLVQQGIEKQTGTLFVTWLGAKPESVGTLVLHQRMSLPTALFALSAEGLRSDFWWQLVTYMFLHGSVWHLTLNMLMMVMFGSAVEDALGSWRFVRVFLLCGIAGALGWLLLGEMWGDNSCVGASAGTYGLIGAFCGFYPKRPLALFGVIDMRARTLAIWLAAASLLNLLIGTENVAYSAHLVGGVFGFVVGAGVRKGKGGRFVWPWALRWHRRPKLRVLEGGKSSPE